MVIMRVVLRDGLIRATRRPASITGGFSMKALTLAAALVVLAPSLAWSHGGGIDQYGCHNDSTKGDYHCHQGKMKGKSYKSQDTMLAAHPDMKDTKAEKKTDSGKKAKADDKAKEGEAKDSKSKSSATR
jgi:hypothetical protein